MAEKTITDYFTEFKTRIEQAQSCGEIAELKLEIEGKVAEMQASITEQLNKLNTIASVPTDLASTIQWITNFIEIIQNPLALLADLQALLTVKLAEMTTALETRAEELECPPEGP